MPFDWKDVTLKAVRLARKGGVVSFADDELGDLERDALVAGLPQWVESKRGWVYIAKNESHPGWLKLGCTRVSPLQRMASLNSTGVLTPWRLVRSWAVHDAFGIETQAHKLLEAHHLQGEIFNLPADAMAEQVIELIAVDRAHLIHGLARTMLPGELEKLLNVEELQLIS